MHNSTDLFTHTYIDNNASKTLVLLHGTGGTEHDFLFLDQAFDKKYNLLGLRGNISEGGMNRFFRRLSAGVFDQESIKKESEKLYQFILDWTHTHNLTPDDLYFLGYSNGANMILAMLFNYPELIKNSIVLHPMLPFEPRKDLGELVSHTVFMTYGIEDHLMSLEDSEHVIKILTSLKINLTVEEYPSGHEISEEEIEEVVQYLLSKAS